MQQVHPPLTIKPQTPNKNKNVGSCGRIKAVGDFKRNSSDNDTMAHPGLKSGDLVTWQAMNQQVRRNTPSSALIRRCFGVDVLRQGSVERFELMRFKKCPRCGAATTRCGCEDGRCDM